MPHFKAFKDRTVTLLKIVDEKEFSPLIIDIEKISPLGPSGLAAFHAIASVLLMITTKLSHEYYSTLNERQKIAVKLLLSTMAEEESESNTLSAADRLIPSLKGSRETSSIIEFRRSFSLLDSEEIKAISDSLGKFIAKWPSEKIIGFRSKLNFVQKPTIAEATAEVTTTDIDDHHVFKQITTAAGSVFLPENYVDTGEEEEEEEEEEELKEEAAAEEGAEQAAATPIVACYDMGPCIASLIVNRDCIVIAHNGGLTSEAVLMDLKRSQTSPTDKPCLSFIGGNLDTATEIADCLSDQKILDICELGDLYVCKVAPHESTALSLHASNLQEIHVAVIPDHSNTPALFVAASSVSSSSSERKRKLSEPLDPGVALLMTRSLICTGGVGAGAGATAGAGAASSSSATASLPAPAKSA
ncbi:hypothetical protein BH10PSE19_BH10PSE19_14690 [soil metagenome]